MIKCLTTSPEHIPHPFCLNVCDLCPYVTLSVSRCVHRGADTLGSQKLMTSI